MDESIGLVTRGVWYKLGCYQVMVSREMDEAGMIYSGTRKLQRAGESGLLGRGAADLLEGVLCGDCRGEGA